MKLYHLAILVGTTFTLASGTLASVAQAGDSNEVLVRTLDVTRLQGPLRIETHVSTNKKLERAWVEVSVTENDRQDPPTTDNDRFHVEGMSYDPILKTAVIKNGKSIYRQDKNEFEIVYKTETRKYDDTFNISDRDYLDISIRFKQ